MFKTLVREMSGPRSMSPVARCSEYMASYISSAGGHILDHEAIVNCRFCKINDTDVFLSQISSNYEDKGLYFGIMWVFIVFNIPAALGLYWLVRMPNVKKVSLKGSPRVRHFQ